MGNRLDSYGRYPSGMQEYLEMYGWHFSKKMCEWAVGKMKKKNQQTGKEEPVEMKSKEQIEEFLKKYGVKIDNAEGYDLVYRYHVGVADYKGSSVADDAHLALYIKDYFSDADGYMEKNFTRFYADSIAMGRPIQFDDYL